MIGRPMGSSPAWSTGSCIVKSNSGTWKPAESPGAAERIPKLQIAAHIPVLQILKRGSLELNAKHTLKCANKPSIVRGLWHLVPILLLLILLTETRNTVEIANG